MIRAQRREIVVQLAVAISQARRELAIAQATLQRRQQSLADLERQLDEVVLTSQEKP